MANGSVRPQSVAMLMKLKTIRGYSGHASTCNALKLAPLVFVRPGELRHAEWSEIDLDKCVWTVPASKMKMGVEHIVPLSRQAVEILRQQQAISGHVNYVFPSIRGQGRPMSENTVNAALRGLGIDSGTHVGHGFRASARTMLDEQLKQAEHAAAVIAADEQLALAVAAGQPVNRAELVNSEAVGASIAKLLTVTRQALQKGQQAAKTDRDNLSGLEAERGRLQRVKTRARIVSGLDALLKSLQAEGIHQRELVSVLESAHTLGLDRILVEAA